MNRSNNYSLENTFKESNNKGARCGRFNNRVGRGGCGRFNNHGNVGRWTNTYKVKRQENQEENHGNQANYHESQNYDKSKLQYHYCNNFGYFVRYCRKNQYDMNKGNANFTRESQIENKVQNNDREFVFITCNVAQENSNAMWFLDNGCSNHMSGKKDMFNDVDNSIKS